VAFVALAIMGAKWKPLILYHLRSGPRRFSSRWTKRIHRRASGPTVACITGGNLRLLHRLYVQRAHLEDQRPERDYSDVVEAARSTLVIGVT
jgi:hypothetical protein